MSRNSGSRRRGNRALKLEGLFTQAFSMLDSLNNRPKAMEPAMEMLRKEYEDTRRMQHDRIVKLAKQLGELTK